MFKVKICMNGINFELEYNLVWHTMYKFADCAFYKSIHAIYVEYVVCSLIGSKGILPNKILMKTIR